MSSVEKKIYITQWTLHTRKLKLLKLITLLLKYLITQYMINFVNRYDQRISPIN